MSQRPTSPEPAGCPHCGAAAVVLDGATASGEPVKVLKCGRCPQRNIYDRGRVWRPAPAHDPGPAPSYGRW